MTSHPPPVHLNPGPGDLPASPDAADPVRRRPRWFVPVAMLALVALALLAVFLRQDGVPREHTMWAEDGPIFAACAYQRSVVDCLMEPYAGYFHTVPRLAAAVAVPFGGGSDLSLRLTLAAGLAAAVAAALAARAVAEASGSWVAGILAGSALVLVYPSGIEALGNLTDLHWVLFPAAVIILVATWVGRPPGLADLALVMLVVLSSALALLLPLLAVGGVVRRTPRARACLLLTVLAFLPQLAVLLGSDRTWAPIAMVVDPYDSLTWAARVVWFGYGYGWLKIAICVLLVVSGLALVPAIRRHPRAMVAPLLAIAALFVTGAATLVISQVRNGALNHRHLLPAAVLWIVAIAIGAAWAARSPATGTVTDPRPDGEPARRTWPRLLLPAIVLLFGVGFAASFRQATLASPGPDVPATIARDRAACADGVPEVRLAISPLIDPPAWFVSIPCSALQP